MSIGRRAAGVTYLCRSDSYSCLAGTGYQGQSVWGSWGPGHNCVSYAAYRLSLTGGRPWSGRIGNGSEWDEKARGAGIVVNTTPAVGSIAQWDGGDGHVAYVELVTDSYIEVSEDSYISDTYGYSSRRRIDRSSGTFAAAEFIHVRDQANVGPPADGALVDYQGKVYRIAGGAPVYVSSWDAVGGPQPTVPLSDAQFGALAPFPADGTLVNTQTGAVYEFAGGAPLYVSSWDAIGGSRPSIRVDQAALDHAGEGSPWDHTRRYPSDGTLVNTGTGAVYVFAGGAPEYVTSWDAIGGGRPSTRVDQAALDAGGETAYPWGHVRRFPVDGTLVNTGTGAVYVFAGGAPLYVSSWDAIGGSRASTRMDQAALDAGGDTRYPWGHVRRYPLDGTTVSVASGEVFVFAGGAPLYVSSWDGIGGQRPSTAVDKAALDAGGVTAYPWGHVRRYPTDGTELSPPGVSHSWVIQKGQARGVKRAPGALADEAALVHAGQPYPWNHLRTTIPGIELRAIPKVTRTSRLTVRWSRPLLSSALTTTDLRWRHGEQSWQTPARWQGTTANSMTVTGLRTGQSYCFSIRGHNTAGLTSGWSRSRCTTRR